MSISQGKLTGMQALPAMVLQYGGQIQRLSATYTQLGSMSSEYTTISTVYPCDVAPMADNVVMSQNGQQSYLTHILHFEPGTDIRDRDQVKIIYSPQPGSYGDIGDVFFISEVVQPSESLAYIRCRAKKAQAVTE
jgi:hypothetical protein